jgi:hypothetical protein
MARIQNEVHYLSDEGEMHIRRDFTAFNIANTLPPQPFFVEFNIRESVYFIHLKVLGH